MPVCTVQLLSLSTPLPTFLSLLARLPEKPLVVSRVIRWIIVPTSLTVEPLLHPPYPWDVLVIFANDKGVPPSLSHSIRYSFTIQAGVPSSLTKNFAQTNERLLHPPFTDIPLLTGAIDRPRIAKSAQNLELSAELREFLRGWDLYSSKGAVSMLNLLAFKEGMHGEYLKYGRAFAESIGRSRGGNAKIVGRVTGGDEGKSKGVWDEIALAHYPTVAHFMDMLASEDYQEVNLKHRVPSLQDTCILMTSELEVPSVGRAKL